jgi:hypothetical protein
MTDTNLTPQDNSIPALARLAPQVMTQYTLAVDTDEAAVQLYTDVKSATLLADGACTVYLSYFDGDNDYLDSQTATAATEASATAAKRLFNLESGTPFTVLQEREFNRVHLITTGNHSLLIYPGYGQANGLPDIE